MSNRSLLVVFFAHFFAKIVRGAFHVQIFDYRPLHPQLCNFRVAQGDRSCEALSRYPLKTSTRPIPWSRKSSEKSSESQDSGGGNVTDVLRSVGAAGNLRFKKTGSNPVSTKREEPNFQVKRLQADDNDTQNQNLKKQARFEDLVDFPCNFQIKVVGSRQGEFVEDILDSIATVIRSKRSDLKHSFRDNGKWRSITVQVPVQTAEQLYEVYAAIGRDPRVKFKF